jgi:hypothetical protein
MAKIVGTKRFAVKLIVLLPRNPGMTREEFIAYYENGHATFWNEVLAEQLKAGTAEYRRNYITRHGTKTWGTGIDPHWHPASSAPLPFDCITEFSFERIEDYQRYTNIRQEHETSRLRTADEAVLFDVSEPFEIYNAEVYQS